MIEFFTGWWQYSFMRSAFLAVMIITPLFGILGTMIVNRKMAFFSDALGHSALTGIAVGVVLGVTDTNLSMVIFAIIFALLLNKISSKSTASTVFFDLYCLHMKSPLLNKYLPQSGTQAVFSDPPHPRSFPV